MPIVGVGYYYYHCQQQMPDAAVSTGHALKQHSCLLCIWALVRERREEMREKQKKIVKINK